ncbi:MAG: hypothetical protein OJF52_000950 [Nitrospira sp.]|nr:MAG: hypothetical protein OJF52_000950 [Nitrospira sp.]
MFCRDIRRPTGGLRFFLGWLPGFSGTLLSPIAGALEREMVGIGRSAAGKPSQTT